MIMTFTSWNEFFQSVLLTLAPIVAGGFLFLIKQAFGYITTKTDAVKNTTIRSGLYAAESEAERLTNTIVSSLNQTVVNDLKGQNGGKISPADAVRIRNDALEKIKYLLSDESKSVILNHKGDIESYLGHLLEEVVGNQKSNIVSLKQIQA